jgi:tyrosinase
MEEVNIVLSDNRVRAINVDKFTEWDGVKPGIHNTGIFLPWHRYFVWRYESALISECGYNGAHPYWDWSLDAELDSLKTSPVFDPVTGFGGDGVNVTDSVIPGLNGRCVIDGPFAGLSVNFGKGPPPNNTIKAEKRCLNRVLNDWTIKRMGWDKAVVPLLNYSTYDQFQNRINYGEDGYGSGLHPNGHSAVGGEVSAFLRFSSPLSAEPSIY